jgi:hypothetical protein
MDKSELPKPWPDDPLSALLANAQHNERASSLNFPDLYALLQRVHAVFEQVSEITYRENTASLLPARFLMPRAHGAWLGAVRLGMSGQAVEAQPLIRVVIENAWYALHIAKDPAPPARTEIWLRRGENAAAEGRCASEFSIANVRKTHETLDAPNAATCHVLYKQAIGYGGHPNERGVLSAMKRMETADVITFEAAILSGDRLLIVAALKEAVEAAIGALKVFRLIFWQRFAIMGVDRDIDKLVNQLNGVFAAYARQLQGPKD